MTGQEITMALLGNPVVQTLEDSENAEQYEGLIPPYIISGQLFPRSTP